MRSRIALSVLVMAVLLFPTGCASSNGDLQSAEKRSKGLRLVLSTDDTQYKPGRAVAVRITAINESGKPIELRFPTAQTHDVVVRNGRGREIWRWSDGRAFAQAFMERRLGAGKRFVMSANWDQKTHDGDYVASGPYTIEGRFSAVGRQQKVGPLIILVTDG